MLEYINNNSSLSTVESMSVIVIVHILSYAVLLLSIRFLSTEERALSIDYMYMIEWV